MRVAEKAQESARSSLQLLRGLNGDSGLLIQLRETLAQLKWDCGIQGAIAVSDADTDLGDRVELELLLICQEALMNVRKHSSARHVNVQLQRVNGYLRLRIADDGCGLPSHPLPESRGFTVMRERAVSMGGRLEVKTFQERALKSWPRSPSSRRACFPSGENNEGTHRR